MKTIMFSSQKGGVGKSYLSYSLSVATARAGKRVLLLDMDKQGSVRQLWSERPEHLAAPNMLDAAPTPEQLPELLKNATAHYDLCVVDTEGSQQTWIDNAMRLADLVVIPAGLNGMDLRAIDATQHYASVNKIPFVFVINKGEANPARAEDVRLLLQKYGKVLPTVIKQRVPHARSTDGGESPLDGPKSPARSELEAFAKEVQEYL